MSWLLAKRNSKPESCYIPEQRRHASVHQPKAHTAKVDTPGRHGLHCKKNPGKYHRHAELIRILHQGLASINMSSLLEPTGLYRDNGNKRPDGIAYTAWERGKALVWDATCADSLAPSGYGFGKSSVTVAVESLGPWSKEAVNLLHRIGSELIKLTGDTKARHYLFQRISLAIQRGNAISVIASIPKSSALEEVYLLP